MFRRTTLFALLLLAGACARDDHGIAQQPEASAPAAARDVAAVQHAPSAAAVGALLQATLPATATVRAATAGPAAFATLPDRGELIGYHADQVRPDGAYTWYRADLSEAHALHSIRSGHLRLTAPDGTALDYAYDHHIEHPSGDWTWIGNLVGHTGEQAVLTFGKRAAYGMLAQPDKLPLRLAVRNGASWVVETDKRKLAGIINAATRPQEPDYFIVPRPTGAMRAAGGATTADAATTAGATTAAAGAAATTVDVVIGYTPGFAADHGGDSGAVTRINYLVDLSNTGYQNSVVSGRVRLVHTMSVNYTDTTSNDSTLEQLSGYKVGTGEITPNAAFNALRAARETYGADLVSLVRKFKDPEHDGCGIAWLVGGGKQPVQPNGGWDFYGYSVVSDGTDAGTDGKTYYCLDQTLAHELGHNMGAAHDRGTASGDDGVLDDPDDYGAFAYSFGYKDYTYDFYTIMAYGDAGQRIYTIFSNPRSTFCGGHACGVAMQADNASTLNQTMPVVATFRPTKVTTNPGTPAPHDVNGDGKSDLLWSKPANSQFAHWLMNGATVAGSKGFTVASTWAAIGSGDFDGNGHTDIVWRNTAGDITLWLGTGTTYSSQFVYRLGAGWTLVGTHDVNGDGKSDLLWSKPSSGQFAHWLMNGATIAGSKGFAISSVFTAQGSGDFDGNGHADIVWRNNNTGDVYLWLGSGTAYSSQLVYRLAAGWSLVGTGDVNGDGKSDLSWSKPSSGQFAHWLMNGATIASSKGFAISSAFTAIGTGDFDGNGRSDVVWRNGSGDIYFWLGTGTAYSSVFVYRLAGGWLPVK